MPLTVRCPTCGKELAAPDELIGKVAACPGCNTQFPVTVSIRGSAPSLLATPTNSVPASGSQNNAPVTIARVSTNLPPPHGSSAPPQPPAASDHRRSHGFASDIAVPASLKSAPAGGAGDVPTVPNSPSTDSSAAVSSSRSKKSQSISTPSTPVPSAAAAMPAASAPAPRGREASPARFIAANPTETRIHLGADGRLPELALEEGAQADTAESGARTSNPLVLAVILAMSFGASAVLLFLDTGARRAESRTQAAARQDLADYYTRPPHPAHPMDEYQLLLRKALQAHNQGKYADERRHYRQVLNMLRDERLQKDDKAVTGLTGVRKGLVPPSDEHLESLLSRLLSAD